MAGPKSCKKGGRELKGQRAASAPSSMRSGVPLLLPVELPPPTRRGSPVRLSTLSPWRTIVRIRGGIAGEMGIRERGRREAWLVIVVRCAGGVARASCEVQQGGGCSCVIIEWCGWRPSCERRSRSASRRGDARLPLPSTPAQLSVQQTRERISTRLDQVRILGKERCADGLFSSSLAALLKLSVPPLRSATLRRTLSTGQLQGMSY